MFGVISCVLALLSEAQAVNPAPDGCYPRLTTAEGCFALFSLTTGQGNTAIGPDALFSDTTGNWNTGVGAVTLALNNADNNTAVGAVALLLNTKGSDNTAVGSYALLHNNDGSDNNAFGTNALFNNVTGSFNNAHGRSALLNNTASENNAFGDLALENNTEGLHNTAIGDDALRFCVEGNSNVAVGDEAGTNIVTGDQNIYIGAGAQGPGDELRFVRIGDSNFTDYDCFIVGIKDRFVDQGTAEFVFVDADQKLGTTLANADGTSMTFKPQAMLDESLKQQKRIAELEATVERQQKGMEVLTAMLKEQAAQIQKVSAQIEMSEPTAKVVTNKP
jgi:hypothetical protein